MMKIQLVMRIVVVMSATLSGCSQQSEIESALKEQLLDPFSAQFSNLAISSDGNSACISWNAKNRMGGYGGWKVATLKKTDDKWSIDIIESNLTCNKKELDSRRAVATARHTARAEALKTVIEGLQKSKALSFQDAEKIAENKCQILAFNIESYSANIAEAKLTGDSKTEEHNKLKLARNLTLLKNGDCASAKIYE